MYYLNFYGLIVSSLINGNSFTLSVRMIGIKVTICVRALACTYFYVPDKENAFISVDLIDDQDSCIYTRK